MKKLTSILCIVAAAFAVSCDKEENPVDPVEDKQIILCSITSPSEGETIQAGMPFDITATGSVSEGKIAEVELFVGGRQVTDVSEFPFTYTYDGTGLTPGKLEIRLTVTGDSGAEASDTVSVEIIEEVVEQTIECRFIQPENGVSVNKGAELVVKGEAVVNTGTVSSVSLYVGGEKIESVTESPFEYTVSTGNYAAGSLIVKMEAQGDQGASDDCEIAVFIMEGEEPAEDSFTDPRDGHVYRTVKMGNQVWMAENLAYLPAVNRPVEGYDSEAGGCDEQPFYYVYGYDGNDVNEAKKMPEYSESGVLYNWYAAIQGKAADAGSPDAIPSGIQGICPDGWHLPSRAEWNELYVWVSSQLPDVDANVFNNETLEYEWIKAKNVSGALRSKTGWPAYSDPDLPDLANGPTDIFGFSVPTGGKCFPRSADTPSLMFSYGNDQGNFWTTDIENGSGGMIAFTYISYDFSYSKVVDYNGMNVRCIKD